MGDVLGIALGAVWIYVVAVALREAWRRRLLSWSALAGSSRKGWPNG